MSLNPTGTDHGSGTYRTGTVFLRSASIPRCDRGCSSVVQGRFDGRTSEKGPSPLPLCLALVIIYVSHLTT